MSIHNQTTIAQLLCVEELSVNFAKMVGDFDAVLDRRHFAMRKTSWDSDEVVTFDLPGMRVLLGLSECPTKQTAGILTISVGASPYPIEPGQNDVSAIIDPNALCKRLVARAQKLVQATDVLWHQIDCVMDADWVDWLTDALAAKMTDDRGIAGIDLPSNERFARRQRASRQMAVIQPKQAAIAANLGKRPASLPVAPANQKTLSSIQDEASLAKLRAALYAHEDETYTTQMRLAVHAMNATLIIVWLPLGVAAMVHGMVKGEDMRLASRLMVAAGGFAALAQTSIGQQVVAFAAL